MNAKKRIAADLGLPDGDAFTQDWVHELPEKYRTQHWLQKYIQSYGRSDYSDEERKLLLDLAMDVTNDLMQSDAIAGEPALNEMAELIRAAPELHRGQLDYWAGDDESLEDSFALASWARTLRASLFGSRS